MRVFDVCFAKAMFNANVSIRLPAAMPWQVAAQEEISQGQKSEKKDAGIVVVKRSVSQDTYKKGYEGSA